VVTPYPILSLPALQERPDLSSLKSQLVLSNAKMRADLAALESRCGSPARGQGRSCSQLAL
jgi:hypothetical protein